MKKPLNSKLKNLLLVRRAFIKERARNAARSLIGILCNFLFGL